VPFFWGGGGGVLWEVCANGGIEGACELRVVGM